MAATIPQTDQVTLEIDGVPVTVPKGTLLVEAAKAIHTDIPVYCYHEKLGPAGLCRICLVAIEGMPKLQIACNTPVAEGMKVFTRGDRVEDGRRAILEFFLLNHPLDCPICDKGGECDLQDYAMAWGQGASRLVDPKTPKPKAVDLGPTIVLDEERCIVCQRCVRFDDIITRERSLRTEDRGAHTIIATATGKPYVSDFTGNVTELCPVGALTSKTYRFRSRPWDNHRTTTSCTQCAVGCGMHVDERQNMLLRTMSVTEDDAVSDAWLCDRGRYNIGFVADERRITQPLLRGADGTFAQIGWDDAIALWAGKLGAAAPDRVAVLGGGRLLNEEALLLRHVHAALGVTAFDHRIGAQSVVHHDGFAGPQDLEHAETIVTIGRPPSELAPVLDLRIRKAVSRRGARLISAGDHPAGSFVSETRAATPEALAAAIGTTPGRLAIVWDGVVDDGWAALLPVLRDAMGGATRVDRYVLPETPNGRGADALRLRPGSGGRDTAAILADARTGKIDVLVVAGANPVLRHPDRALAQGALDGAAFTVVTELFLTETARGADLVLPVCSAFEKSGTTTNLAGEILPVVGSVRPPEGVLADGDVFVLLAEALGVALPSIGEMESLIGAALADSGGFQPEDPVGLSLSKGDSDGGLRVVAQHAIFTGGGTLAHDAALRGLRRAPRATLHPATAAALGVAQGDVVTAGANGAELTGLTVVLDPAFPQSAVGLLDGIPEAPLNALGGAASVTMRPLDPLGVTP